MINLVELAQALQAGGYPRQSGMTAARMAQTLFDAVYLQRLVDLDAGDQEYLAEKERLQQLPEALRVQVWQITDDLRERCAQTAYAAVVEALRGTRIRPGEAAVVASQAAGTVRCVHWNAAIAAGEGV